jgi:hypothetical protein
LCAVLLLLNCNDHVSRKFAAMSSSRAMSGATLNSGMLRVVLQHQQAPGAAAPAAATMIGGQIQCAHVGECMLQTALTDTHMICMTAGTLHGTQTGGPATSSMLRLAAAWQARLLCASAASLLNTKQP